MFRKKSKIFGRIRKGSTPGSGSKKNSDPDPKLPEEFDPDLQWPGKQDPDSQIQFLLTNTGLKNDLPQNLTWFGFRPLKIVGLNPN